MGKREYRVNKSLFTRPQCWHTTTRSDSNIQPRPNWQRIVWLTPSHRDLLDDHGTLLSVNKHELCKTWGESNVYYLVSLWLNHDVQPEIMNWDISGRVQEFHFPLTTKAESELTIRGPDVLMLWPTIWDSGVLKIDPRALPTNTHYWDYR